jgi:hypothetical protein
MSSKVSTENFSILSKTIPSSLNTDQIYVDTSRFANKLFRINETVKFDIKWNNNNNMKLFNFSVLSKLFNKLFNNLNLIILNF